MRIHVGQAERRWVMACVVTLLLAIALAATGCSGGYGDTTQAGIYLTPFDSGEHGFTIMFPSGYVRTEPPVDQDADPSLMYQVYFADPEGAQSAGTALDVLAIAVHRMNRTASRDDFREHLDEFRQMAHGLVGKRPKLRMVEPFEVAVLGGKPALRGVFSYRISGQDVAAMAYLVPVEDRAYWIVGQASRGTWDSAGRLLGSSIDSIEFAEPEE